MDRHQRQVYITFFMSAFEEALADIENEELVYDAIIHAANRLHGVGVYPKLPEEGLSMETYADSKKAVLIFRGPVLSVEMEYFTERDDYNKLVAFGYQALAALHHVLKVKGIKLDQGVH